MDDLTLKPYNNPEDINFLHRMTYWWYFLLLNYAENGWQTFLKLRLNQINDNRALVT